MAHNTWHIRESYSPGKESRHAFLISGIHQARHVAACFYGIECVGKEWEFTIVGSLEGKIAILGERQSWSIGGEPFRIAESIAYREMHVGHSEPVP